MLAHVGSGIVYAYSVYYKGSLLLVAVLLGTMEWGENVHSSVSYDEMSHVLDMSAYPSA